MNSRIRHAYVVGIAVALFLCVLSSQYIRKLSTTEGFFRETAILLVSLTDKEDAQWMTVVCIGIYFATLTFLLCRLEGRQTKGGPEAAADKWRFRFSEALIIGFAGFALTAYAREYQSAYPLSDCLTLIAGITLGRAVAVLRLWRNDVGHLDRVHASVLPALVFVLVIAAVVHPDMGRTFRYRGEVRWMGPTFNPNTYGLLMGVGLVLAMGQVFTTGIRRARCFGVSLPPQTTNQEPARSETREGREKFDVRSRNSEWVLWLTRGWYALAAGIMGVGLVKSYSRGAWMGTAVGLTYLAWAMLKRRGDAGRGPDSERRGIFSGGWVGWTQRNRVALVVVAVSLLVLAFWNLRHTEQRLVRRAFSVGNLNDFSWRNRVTTAVGALQMMADRPWFGFGWNQVEKAYTDWYRPPTLSESFAIHLNDYAVLGTTLGLPALACLLGYVGLKFTRGHRSYVRVGGAVSATDRKMAVCRAAFLVLLLGFTVERGIFYIAHGAPFWVLLELGAGPAMLSPAPNPTREMVSRNGVEPGAASAGADANGWTQRVET